MRWPPVGLPHWSQALWVGHQWACPTGAMIRLRPRRKFQDRPTRALRVVEYHHLLTAKTVHSDAIPPLGHTKKASASPVVQGGPQAKQMYSTLGSQSCKHSGTFVARAPLPGP
jgi:hypothetical protein